MFQLKDIEQYKKLKGEAKDKLGKLSSNCFLTSGGMAAIIERQPVLYEVYDQGVVFYIDEGTYYRAFYFLDSEKGLPEMRQDKLVEIEEPDSNGRRSTYLMQFFQELEQAGWKRIARNIQVSSTLAERSQQIERDYQDALDAAAGQGFSIANCPKRHAARVVELWSTFLHETDIPAEHVNFADDPSQRVVVVLNDDDYVCATNWWRWQGGQCEIRHTVTDPAYYKRGLGYLLQCAAMKDALDNGCRTVFTYIDDRNYRSIGMFEKAGIVANGKTTVQYGLQGYL